MKNGENVTSEALIYLFIFHFCFQTDCCEYPESWIYKIDAKNKSMSVSGNALLTRKVGWWWQEAFGHLNYSLHLSWAKKFLRNIQNVEPCGKWCATAEDHIGFHSCQPRTRIWVCCGHRLAKKLDSWTLEKCHLVIHIKLTDN